jgi:hypothetical protein
MPWYHEISFHFETFLGFQQTFNSTTSALFLYLISLSYDDYSRYSWMDLYPILGYNLISFCVTQYTLLRAKETQ